MAAARLHTKRHEMSKFRNCIKFFASILDRKFFTSILFDVKFCQPIAAFLIVLELFINVVVIFCIKYTEIDWKAYMSEVGAVIVDANYDYSTLKGDTGPLVYPAGFVWIYSALYYLTDAGQRIVVAQFIFALIYIFLLALVFRILVITRTLPPYVLVLISLTSYRIHSIFVLRLFNDPIAMFFVYGAINLFLSSHWSLGSFLFSLAVSVKMNILLFAPALLAVYLINLGFFRTIRQLLICASVQIMVALPFLINNPINYLIGSFDFGRVFFHQWTVNWRFLPIHIFEHRGFHVSLLVGHIMTLAFFAPIFWRKLQSPNPSTKPMIIHSLFMSNFIGIVYARSLHYQFYVWYYHQIPYLLWQTTYSPVIKLLIWGFIECCWNTFPSTFISSGLLHVCHIAILGGIAYTFYPHDQNLAQCKQS